MSFSSFLAKNLFCMGDFVSTKWPESCTLTAHLCLLRDSPSQLRILWSAVIRTPNFSTLLMENFLVCCYQFTNIFGALYQITGAFSATSPCDFRPFAYFAFQVPWKCVITLCLPDPRSGRGTGRRGSGRLALSRPEDEAFSSVNLSAKSCDHSGKSLSWSLRAQSSLSFDSRSRDEFLRAEVVGGGALLELEAPPNFQRTPLAILADHATGLRDCAPDLHGLRFGLVLVFFYWFLSRICSH